MRTWIIEPRDSLIVRDGRPFGLGAGMRATSLDFPFPSTTTGGVRTQAGLDDQDVFDRNLISSVKQIAVKGPLLVELNQNSEITDWLMPAPSDSVVMSDETDNQKAHIKHLAPIDASPGLTNLSEVHNDLLPVGVDMPLKGKPLSSSPRYWSWNTKYHDWLNDARDDSIDLKKLEIELGHSGPEKDARVHVSINPESFTSSEGELFQTRGLEFRRMLPGGKLKDTRRLALAVFVDDTPQVEKIRTRLTPFGGERRLVMWRADVSDKAKTIQECPEDVKNKIVGSGYCRLLLLTPAFFERGTYPKWLLQARLGITPQLMAIAHNRYQVVSGWDFAKVVNKNGRTVLGEPKPTRRLVPSGAVFFLKLEGDPEARTKWIDEIWFSCVSDDGQNEQDFRRDGFGLAVIGGWDGTTMKIE